MSYDPIDDAQAAQYEHSLTATKAECGVLRDENAALREQLAAREKTLDHLRERDALHTEARGMLEAQLAAVTADWKEEQQHAMTAEAALAAVTKDRDEARLAQAMAVEAFNAADAFIQSHVADPDITREMREKYSAYLLAKASIPAVADYLAKAKAAMEDAERWRALMELCGYWQDGSQTTVTLFQDDATCSCFIKVGDEYYGTDRSSFESALDAARRT